MTETVFFAPTGSPHPESSASKHKSRREIERVRVPLISLPYLLISNHFHSLLEIDRFTTARNCNLRIHYWLASFPPSIRHRFSVPESTAVTKLSASSRATQL